MCFMVIVTISKPYSYLPTSEPLNQLLPLPHLSPDIRLAHYSGLCSKLLPQRGLPSPSCIVLHPLILLTIVSLTVSYLPMCWLVCCFPSLKAPSEQHSVHDASPDSDTFKGKLKAERPQINGHSMLKEQEEGGHGQSKGTRRRVSPERQARFGSQRPLWTRASALGFVLSTKGSLWGAVDKWHHRIVQPKDQSRCYMTNRWNRARDKAGGPVIKATGTVPGRWDGGPA